jgi:hypothetical protein
LASTSLFTSLLTCGVVSGIFSGVLDTTGEAGGAGVELATVEMLMGSDSWLCWFDPARAEPNTA